ncbi:PEP-CTERM sorting domain-containing protein [Rubritalea sp.]|uniref:PEP-CTERM sorting domain-containing protein n=1 Tax=Rubritalea sp. TaxID=2109375 RepID=UPI003EF7B633
MKTTYCVFVVGAVLWANAQAAIVLFNLRDLTGTTSIEAGLYEVDGVILTMTSTEGSLNQTANAFGVNHFDSGDLTAEIDGVAGAESLSFSFNATGLLDQLTFSSVGGSDYIRLTKNGGGAVDYSANTVSPSIAFTSSDVFKLEYVSGNGMSFDSISITSVPEPTSTILLGMGGLALLSRRKRTQRIRSIPKM